MTRRSDASFDLLLEIIPARDFPGIDPGKITMKFQHFAKFFDRVVVSRGMGNENVTVLGSHGVSGVRHQVLLDSGFSLGFDSSSRLGNLSASLPHHQLNSFVTIFGLVLIFQPFLCLKPYFAKMLIAFRPLQAPRFFPSIHLKLLKYII
jgi:hypothetical protein